MKKYDPVIYHSEDLINYLSAKLAPHRISRAVIKDMVDGEIEFIRLVLLGGDKVYLHDVGTFKLGYVSPKPEREVINPVWLYKDRTAPKMIPAPAMEEYNAVRFRAAKSLKEELKKITYGDAYKVGYEEDYDDEEVELDGEETISE